MNENGALPKINLVAVQMESFTGNVRPGVFDQRTVDGLKKIKKSGVKVVLVYHNKEWAETADTICKQAGLDGNAISPEYVMQSAHGAMTREKMLQPFGATPRESLFIGNDLTDAIAAHEEGMYAFQFNGTYNAKQHDRQIGLAIRQPQALVAPRRS